MNFLKEYGSTILSLTLILGTLFFGYYYFEVYIPRRDGLALLEQKRVQEVSDAIKKKDDDANSILYKKECERIEQGNERILAFQITSCGNDQACIDYAKNTVKVGATYIDTCINLKRLGNL